jgi:hypothetical protein
LCKVKGDWTVDRAELKDADGWGGTACWPIHPPKNSRRDGLLGDVGVPAKPGHVAAARRPPATPGGSLGTHTTSLDFGDVRPRTPASPPLLSTSHRPPLPAPRL